MQKIGILLHAYNEEVYTKALTEAGFEYTEPLPLIEGQDDTLIITVETDKLKKLTTLLRKLTRKHNRVYN